MLINPHKTILEDHVGFVENKPPRLGILIDCSLQFSIGENILNANSPKHATSLVIVLMQRIVN